jgi:hypothetical protein
VDSEKQFALLMDAGSVTALLWRHSPEAWDQLARDPRLTATNRAMLQIIAEARRELYEKVGL